MASLLCCLLACLLGSAAASNRLLLATQPEQPAAAGPSQSSNGSTPRPAAPAAAAANCTPPRTGEDAAKPFCVVPDTISPEAQAFLSNASAGAFAAIAGPSKDTWKNQTVFDNARQLFDDVSRNGSAAAVAQFLQATENTTIAGVPVVYGTPKGFDNTTQGNKLLIYLHGGGYYIGSCHIQWATVAQVAQQSGLRVLCIEYRLAPEHPFPAGLHDALAVYKELIGKQGYDASNIVLLGDSAGGGLALAVVIQLQREGIALPAALGLFSPAVDLGTGGDTMATLVAVDPIILVDLLEGLPGGTLAYVSGNEALLSDPLVSPLRADYGAFNGTFPPTLLQVGLRDSLLSTSVLLYRKLRAAAAGVCPTQRVVFSPWEAMWHVFQAFFYLPEAREANAEMAAFFVSSLNGSADCSSTS